MEPINGIKILRQDLKEEGGEYLFFKALKNILNTEHITINAPLNDQLFTHYESLSVNPEDQLMGENNGNSTVIGHIPGVYALAQQMFASE